MVVIVEEAVLHQVQGLLHLIAEVLPVAVVHLAVILQVVHLLAQVVEVIQEEVALPDRKSVV